MVQDTNDEPWTDEVIGTALDTIAGVSSRLRGLRATGPIDDEYVLAIGACASALDQAVASIMTAPPGLDRGERPGA